MLIHSEGPSFLPALSVLIAAKCNVNFFVFSIPDAPVVVLIAAKCNVN